LRHVAQWRHGTPTYDANVLVLGFGWLRRKASGVTRSLDFADQHRLVIVFLRIDGMRKRKNRDLYLSVLERELGY
jgi:hypothetical protein